MTPFAVGWYVAYTKPQQERRTAQALVKLKIEVYLPVIPRLRQWSDRRKIINSILFPSYIFIRLNDVQEYFSSLKVDSICYYVRFNNKPARVRQETVDHIRMAVDHGKNITVSSEEYHNGQKVTIGKGALTGLKGEVIKKNGSNKMLIRVELLCRNVLIDISMADMILMPD